MRNFYSPPILLPLLDGHRLKFYPSVADDILEAEVQVSGVAAATTQNVDTHASSSSFVAASAITTEPEASLLIPLPTQDFQSLIRIGKRECKPSQRAHESNLMSE